MKEQKLNLYRKKTQKWIADGINPWYFERLNRMLDESECSPESVNIFLKELDGFESEGCELAPDIVRDMGEELIMTDEEMEMPLIDRMVSAIKRAKAKIDAYPEENYKMLKELISYIIKGDDEKYTDVQNTYGADAITCEYIVANINFALKNLGDKPYIEGDGIYRSGTTWLDRHGSKISAGGGQIIKGIDGKYYWYGEDNKVAYSLHTGVSCYSTIDFKTWTYEGLAFNIFDNSIEANKQFAEEFLTDAINRTAGRIERPKVIYNASNNTYVMWMHLEKNNSYTFSKAGVAVSYNGPSGPFEWKWYGSPVYDPGVTYNAKVGQHFRDMNLFVDDDGTAYVIYSSEANHVPYIARLNRDYTWIDTEGMNTVTRENFEAGIVSYNKDGIYTTGKIYGFNKDGTGYADENGNDVTFTTEDLKSLTYLDTTTHGRYNNNEILGKHNYYLPSYNRWQLICGNRIFVRKGDTVDRGDGLNFVPINYSKYGRWAKIGQNVDGCSTQREAPALIKHNGLYYMIASGISGWRANKGIYLRTDNLFGEWETCSNPFIGEGQTDYSGSYSGSRGMWEQELYPTSDTSFLSQSTSIFEYNGGVWYMGDRWKDGDYWMNGHYGVKKSTYVWLPVEFDEKGNMTIRWCDETKVAQ